MYGVFTATIFNIAWIHNNLLTVVRNVHYNFDLALEGAL